MYSSYQLYKPNSSLGVQSLPLLASRRPASFVSAEGPAASCSSVRCANLCLEVLVSVIAVYARTSSDESSSKELKPGTHTRMWLKFIRSFSAFDLAAVAMLAALGIASKPVVGPLARLVTGPLNMPGGVVAGGFYMVWIVMARILTGRVGAAFLTGLVQGILVLALGIYGNHGVMTLVTYSLPGFAADLMLFPMRRRRVSALAAFAAGAAANVAGTAAVAQALFRLPAQVLVLALAVAALTGGLGGLVALAVASKLSTGTARTARICG